ncbi:unnamed protein product, partial [Leptidea sinapis]
ITKYYRRYIKTYSLTFFTNYYYLCFNNPHVVLLLLIARLPACVQFQHLPSQDRESSGPDSRDIKMYECSKGSFHCRTKVGASGSEVPRIKLSNGAEMPAIALGAYLGFDQNGIIRPREHNLRDVIVRAIDVGYRHFDTASIYETEAEVGQAVRLKIAEGAVHRHDIFITTKLWNTQHRRDQVVSSLKESLKKMGLSYVDLYLMHWPIGLNEDYSYSDADYMETWRGLEDAQWLGLTRSIGVSNFNQDQLQRVIVEGSIKPVALQIEFSKSWWILPKDKVLLSWDTHPSAPW